MRILFEELLRMTRRLFGVLVVILSYVAFGGNFSTMTVVVGVICSIAVITLLVLAYRLAKPNKDRRNHRRTRNTS